MIFLLIVCIAYSTKIVLHLLLYRQFYRTITVHFNSSMSVMI